MNRFLIPPTIFVLSLLAGCATATAPGGRAVGTPSPSPATNGPAGVPRMKLYATAPNVVAGPDTDENPLEPTIDLYLPPADQATGAAVLVLPGGGYSNLAMGHEGAQVGQFFLAHNVAAFVLRYRHGPRYHFPTTLLDAQRAMRVIRAHADELHVDPAKLGILGFSAGGHLAAMTTTLYDNKLLPESPYVPDLTDALSAKPAFALLLYPVVDLTDDNVTHRGSRTNLTQNNPALYAELSPQKHVTRDTPPVFLVHGTNDPAVPVMNSILFYEACVKAGVPAEMHILENAPHGFGMGATQNIQELKEWPNQALRFMARHKWIPAG
jgi:acetyl esterase/lipase